MKNRTINVKGSEITVSRKEQEYYISLTDIARYKNPAEPIDVIKNWMRNRSTIEFIGLWEQLHNPDFKASNSTALCTRPAAGASYAPLAAAKTRWCVGRTLQDYTFYKPHYYQISAGRPTGSSLRCGQLRLRRAS